MHKLIVSKEWNTGVYQTRDKRITVHYRTHAQQPLPIAAFDCLAKPPSLTNDTVGITG